MGKAAQDDGCDDDEPLPSREAAGTSVCLSVCVPACSCSVRPPCSGALPRAGQISQVAETPDQPQTGRQPWVSFFLPAIHQALLGGRLGGCVGVLRRIEPWCPPRSIPSPNSIPRRDRFRPAPGAGHGSECGSILTLPELSTRRRHARHSGARYMRYGAVLLVLGSDGAVSIAQMQSVRRPQRRASELMTGSRPSVRIGDSFHATAGGAKAAVESCGNRQRCLEMRRSRLTACGSRAELVERLQFPIVHEIALKGSGCVRLALSRVG